jgi:hypothetical protein
MHFGGSYYENSEKSKYLVLKIIHKEEMFVLTLINHHAITNIWYS